MEIKWPITWWRKMRLRRRRRIMLDLIQKQRTILQQGTYVKVEVIDCFKTNMEVGGMVLMRIKLSVHLTDSKLSACSSTFTNVNPHVLIGKTIRVKFMPGDLSHVVLVA